MIIQYAGGSYHEFGLEFFRHLLDFCEPKRDATLLEVGCGTGRMAIPWTAYLTDEGSYDGFDIMPAGIAWCRSAIGSRHANFRFHHADMRNSFYNPAGAVDPIEYRFAFPPGSFDVVSSPSVSTHLPVDVIAHYLA